MDLEESQHEANQSDQSEHDNHPFLRAWAWALAWASTTWVC
jgi:hypothetical protein